MNNYELSKRLNEYNNKRIDSIKKNIYRKHCTFNNNPYLYL